MRQYIKPHIWALRSSNDSPSSGEYDSEFAKYETAADFIYVSVQPPRSTRMSSPEAANEGATAQISAPLDDTKEGKPGFETNVVAAEADDFPDGGLRAWLVLSGVSGIQ